MGIILNMSTSDIPDKLPYEIFLPITTKVVDGILDGYFISNYARVYSRISKKYKKCTIVDPETAYYKFSVACTTEPRERTVLLHRVLLMTFCPVENMENLVVNHKDGIKTHTFLPNLEWTTTKGNAIHARDHGLLQPRHGEEHPDAIISEATCKRICDLLETRQYRHSKIAKMLDVPVTVVQEIYLGHSWKHVSSGYTFVGTRSERPSEVFTYTELCKVCEYFQDNPKPENISIRSYINNCLVCVGVESINESKLNSIRKLYKKERWKYIYSQYNY